MSLAHEHSEVGRALLAPPRFSLRTLLVTMGLLSGLFALMTWIGMLWSLVLALVLGLVMAHVLGNSLGTRLRDGATRQAATVPEHAPPAFVLSAGSIAAGPTRLTRRAKLHRITLIMTIGGALVGAELGALGSTLIYPDAMAAAVLGVISAAVLGGFAGFLVSSFLSTIRQALAEAHRGAAPSSARRSDL